MTSITDVPLNDVKLFLSKNKVKVPEQDMYRVTLDMIKKGKGINHPDSLIDFIIAYNLYNEGKNIRHYNRGEIELMSDKELKKLAESLDIFESNNYKESVLNILSYLKKLDTGIVHPDIDRLIYQNIEDIILSASYYEIIEIFNKNKSLRKFIYDNLAQIIYNNSYDEDYGGYKYDQLAQFIVDLMKINEIILAKEALRISANVLTDEDHRGYFNLNINDSVVRSADSRLIEEYFKLLPYLRNLYKEEALDDLSIIDIFYQDVREFSSTQEYRNLMIPFLTAAIKVNNRYFIDSAIEIWEGDVDYFDASEHDKWLVDEMNALIATIKQ